MLALEKNNPGCTFKLVFVTPESIFPYIKQQKFTTTEGHVYKVLPKALEDLEQLTMELFESN